MYLHVFLLVISCSTPSSEYIDIKKLTNIDLNTGLIIFFNPDGCLNCIEKLDSLLFENSFNQELILVMVSRNSKPYIDKYSTLTTTIIVDSSMKSIKLNLFKDVPVVYKLKNNEVQKIELNLDEDFTNKFRKNGII
jgi:hypothetical protein